MDSIFINTPNGNKISVTQFIPETIPKGLVVISSATGVKQTLYFKIATYLEQHNFAVYTFDYSGIGASKLQSLKKFNTSASLWATNDLEAVIQYAKKNHTATKLCLMGHSIGGQLIGLAPSSKEADGILLVAGQTGFWKLWSGLGKWKMCMTWYVLIPVLTKLFGYFPGKKIGASEDLPKDMALEWRTWCCSPNYLFDHVSNAEQSYSAIKCPIYSYSAQDDNYAPKVTVDWLTNQFKGQKAIRKHLIPKEVGISKIGHFGYFRSKNKASIWELFLSDIKTLTS